MEITTTGLSRKAKEVLTEAGLYIDYYQQAKGKKPDRIILSKRQWRVLSHSLKTNHRSTRNPTYQGVPLEIDDE